MNWKIIESADGSHTLHSGTLKESYHSRHGAMRESRYVFIEQGLKQFSSGLSLNILEVGFGTGLNALLTCLMKEGRAIRYTALEPYPVPEELLAQLNYADGVGEIGAGEVFQDLHRANWEEETEIRPGFIFEKRKEALLNFSATQKFDLVYYDAFGFHAQPEMWQKQCWSHLYGLMAKGGKWVSYCAKGEVRRGLSEAGFVVERLPGPPGKREMLRATK